MGKQISIKGTAKPGRKRQYKDAAARQKAYRERKQRADKYTVQITLDADNYFALMRIANHNSVTKSKVVSSLVKSFDARLLKGMTDEQADKYLS